MGVTLNLAWPRSRSCPPGPVMAAALAAILRRWGAAWAIGACCDGQRETWTAGRLDGDGWLAAASAGELSAMIAADDARRPAQRREEAADPLLRRLRAQNPGWAITEHDAGVTARRGGDVIAAGRLGALRAQLGQRAHDDARDAALGRRQ